MVTPTFSIGPDRFSQFACFDWSGQNVARPRGLALAVAGRTGAPRLVTRMERWSRRDALNWLLRVAASGADMLIGLDLSFALPFADANAYFPGSPIGPGDARELWDMVDRTSTADPHLSVDGFLSHPEMSRYFRQHGGRLGDRFGGHPLGRVRVVEARMRDTGLARPASGFNLVGAAQVGKSSLTGMRVLHRLRGAIPIWPFDALPARGPVIVEIYPAIAARAGGVRAGRSKIRTPAALSDAMARLNVPRYEPPAMVDDHASDALITAAWLRRVSADPAMWSPPPLAPEIALAEGWTFGVA